MEKAEKYGWSGPGALIGASELERLLGKEGTRVVEIRQEADYEAGHIPGSVRISRQELEDPDAAFEGMMATPGQMGSLLSRRGIAADDALAVAAGASPARCCCPSRKRWTTPTAARPEPGVSGQKAAP